MSESIEQYQERLLLTSIKLLTRWQDTDTDLFAVSLEEDVEQLKAETKIYLEAIYLGR